MKSIHLSKTVIAAYREAKVNVSYALSELLGTVDYDYSSKLNYVPVFQQDTVEVQIDDTVYRELEEKFDGIESFGAIAEILLWSNYFMGATL